MNTNWHSTFTIDPHSSCTGDGYGNDYAEAFKLIEERIQVQFTTGGSILHFNRYNVWALVSYVEYKLQTKFPRVKALMINFYPADQPVDSNGAFLKIADSQRIFISKHYKVTQVLSVWTRRGNKHKSAVKELRIILQVEKPDS